MPTLDLPVVTFIKKFQLQNVLFVVICFLQHATCSGCQGKQCGGDESLKASSEARSPSDGAMSRRQRRSLFGTTQQNRVALFNGLGSRNQGFDGLWSGGLLGRNGDVFNNGFEPASNARFQSLSGRNNVGLPPAMGNGQWRQEGFGIYGRGIFNDYGSWTRPGPNSGSKGNIPQRGRQENNRNGGQFNSYGNSAFRRGPNAFSEYGTGHGSAAGPGLGNNNNNNNNFISNNYNNNNNHKNINNNNNKFFGGFSDREGFERQDSASEHDERLSGRRKPEPKLERPKETEKPKKSENPRKLEKPVSFPVLEPDWSEQEQLLQPKGVVAGRSKLEKISPKTNNNKQQKPQPENKKTEAKNIIQLTAEKQQEASEGSHMVSSSSNNDVIRKKKSKKIATTSATNTATIQESTEKSKSTQNQKKHVENQQKNTEQVLQKLVKQQQRLLVEQQQKQKQQLLAVQKQQQALVRQQQLLLQSEKAALQSVLQKIAQQQFVIQQIQDNLQAKQCSHPDTSSVTSSRMPLLELQSIDIDGTNRTQQTSNNVLVVNENVAVPSGGKVQMLAAQNRLRPAIIEYQKIEASGVDMSEVKPVTVVLQPAMKIENPASMNAIANNASSSSSVNLPTSVSAAMNQIEESKQMAPVFNTVDFKIDSNKQVNEGVVDLVLVPQKRVEQNQEIQQLDKNTVKDMVINELETKSIFSSLPSALSESIIPVVINTANQINDDSASRKETTATSAHSNTETIVQEIQVSEPVQKQAQKTSLEILTVACDKNAAIMNSPTQVLKPVSNKNRDPNPACTDCSNGFDTPTLIIRPLTSQSPSFDTSNVVPTIDITKADTKGKLLLVKQPITGKKDETDVLEVPLGIAVANSEAMFIQNKESMDGNSQGTVLLRDQPFAPASLSSSATNRLLGNTEKQEDLTSIAEQINAVTAFVANVPSASTTTKQQPASDKELPAIIVSVNHPERAVAAEISNLKTEFSPNVAASLEKQLMDTKTPIDIQGVIKNEAFTSEQSTFVSEDKQLPKETSTIVIDNFDSEISLNADRNGAKIGMAAIDKVEKQEKQDVLGENMIGTSASSQITASKDSEKSELERASKFVFQMARSSYNQQDNTEAFVDQKQTDSESDFKEPSPSQLDDQSNVSKKTVTVIVTDNDTGTVTKEEHLFVNGVEVATKTQSS